jgi:hypothetical protein
MEMFMNKSNQPTLKFRANAKNSAQGQSAGKVLTALGVR